MSKPSVLLLMKLKLAILILFVSGATVALAALIPWNAPPHQQETELLTSLGVNNNRDVSESSGLAYSQLIKDSIWTINDSGHSAEVLMLKTDGTLQAKVSIKEAKNVDWEAMAGFQFEGQPYLVVADVGDNSKRRKEYQLYVFREPDLSSGLNPDAKLPLKKKTTAVKISFNYEDGPKDCEAIGVDVSLKQIWLVEKIFYSTDRTTSPGIYVLPLVLPGDQAKIRKPLIAKRIADFPPRNVTGMDFSSDGKRLIIRNYLNAHLYTRFGDEDWRSVVLKSKPEEVVLPLQRQGEAICFTPDSQSVIVTSELTRQPIWQVNLQPNIAEKPAEK